MSHAAYHKRRRAAALPRWKAAYDMKQAGHKYKDIAAAFQITIRRAFTMVENYASHRIAVSQLSSLNPLRLKIHIAPRVAEAHRRPHRSW